MNILIYLGLLALSPLIFVGLLFGIKAGIKEAWFVLIKSDDKTQYLFILGNETIG